MEFRLKKYKPEKCDCNVCTLSPEENEAIDILVALKEGLPYKKYDCPRNNEFPFF